MCKLIISATGRSILNRFSGTRESNSWFQKAKKWKWPFFEKEIARKNKIWSFFPYASSSNFLKPRNKAFSLVILANSDQFSQTEKSVFAAEMGKNMKIRDFEDFHHRFWFKMAVFWAPSRHIQGKKRPDFCDLHFWAHMPSRSQKRVIWDFEMLIHESPIFTEISLLDVHMPLLTQIQKSTFFLKCLVHHRGHVQKKVSKSPRRHTSLIFDDFGWLIISATGRSILNRFSGTGNWWFSCTRIIVQNWSSGGRGE